LGLAGVLGADHHLAVLARADPLLALGRERHPDGLLLARLDLGLLSELVEGLVVEGRGLGLDLELALLEALDLDLDRALLEDLGLAVALQLQRRLLRRGARG